MYWEFFSVSLWVSACAANIIHVTQTSRWLCHAIVTLKSIQSSWLCFHLWFSWNHSSNNFYIMDNAESRTTKARREGVSFRIPTFERSNWRAWLRFQLTRRKVLSSRMISDVDVRSSKSKSVVRSEKRTFPSEGTFSHPLDQIQMMRWSVAIGILLCDVCSSLSFETSLTFEMSFLVGRRNDFRSLLWRPRTSIRRDYQVPKTPLKRTQPSHWTCHRMWSRASFCRIFKNRPLNVAGAFEISFIQTIISTSRRVM